MDKDRSSRWRPLGFVLSLLTASCAVAVEGEDLVDEGSLELGWRRAIEFTPIDDPDIAGGEREVRRVIRSAKQYERLFGHAPPGDVAFERGDLVVFYSAGTQPSGGFEASIESIEYRWGTLHVTTRLTSPGDECGVTLALTHPYALVKLKRPFGLHRVRFETDDVVRDCEPPPSCDELACPLGSHCELVQLWCIRTPCPALPRCVPDEPPPPACGGIAGTPCPGAGTCADDPDDDCDPENGGADCGGLCRCDAIGLCVEGFVWDDSPAVCGCVPDPTRDPCAAVRCAAGTHCEADGGSATCVPDAFCGGIAGFACPGAGTCIDDPGDDCHPEDGGADCGGLCICDVLGTCEEGYVWDDSAEVCGCVAETNPCAAVLCQTGTTCEVVDGEPYCLSDGSLECGSTTCATGTVCCNASCGVCTPPGFFCTQEACVGE